MKMISKIKKGKRICNDLTIIFVVFCSIIMLMLSKSLFEDNRITKSSITEYLNYSIPLKQSYINLYGGIQRIIGKKAIKDFSVLKSDYRKLIRIHDLENKADVDDEVEKILPIFDYCQEKDIPCIYLTSILPLQDKADLPYPNVDYEQENAELLLAGIKQAGIPYYDLRTLGSVSKLKKEQLFYYTDHHWSTDSCFAVFHDLIVDWNSRYGFDLDSHKIEIENYEEKTLQNAFLGSFGVDVGKYYDGKDDFVVYYPKFDTNLSFEGYDETGSLILQKEGDWFTCLMDQDILNDPTYDNKYSSWSNKCFVENRVVNHLADNDLKMLYISHSYGRPMTQYLSTCFKEVRNLDPQTGRFEGNYLDYIDDYQPDIVVLQVECEGTIYGDFDTDR